MGSKRGTSSQQSVVPGIIRTRADAPMKMPRQRRRTGGASSKSMCAASTSCAKAIKSTMETAEPIKRTTELEAFDGTKISSGKSSEKCCHEEVPHELSSEVSLSDSGLHSPCHAVGKGFLKTSTLESVQTSEPNLKLKLQLFPIDEVTRKDLEKDGHNPYLELTLGARKKISSVLKHLNTKWGKSGIALGELVLFPYNIKQENLASYRRWTSEDIDTSASDVHAAIGCPPIFRLRYGWFSTLEPITSQVPHFTSLSYDGVKPKEVQEGCTNMKDMDVEKQPFQEDMPVNASTLSNATSATPIPSDQAVDVGNLRTGSDTTLSSALWTDTLTNLSMGDLLKETNQNTEGGHRDPLPVDKNSCLSQISFSSDSFDAAIAALISRHQGAGLSTPAFHSSIWNAEETCHPFPFQKNSTSSEVVGEHSQGTAFGPFSHIAMLNSASLPVPDKDCDCQVPTPDLLHGLDNTQSNFRMTDITWPDSLGPLDLGLTSSTQIISGDSISLSGLIASSLDAFQNCSFLGKD